MKTHGRKVLFLQLKRSSHTLLILTNSVPLSQLWAQMIDAMKLTDNTYAWQMGNKIESRD